MSILGAMTGVVPSLEVRGKSVPSFVRDELSFLKLDSVLVDLNWAVLIFFS